MPVLGRYLVWLVRNKQFSLVQTKQELGLRFGTGSGTKIKTRSFLKQDPEFLKTKSFKLFFKSRIGVPVRVKVDRLVGKH
jgi:hypothetical protein